MKTIQKISKNESSKSIPSEYKSIDTSVVPVTTVQLSAKTRSEQRKNVKRNKMPLEHLKEDISKLAQPKKIHHRLETPIVNVSKRALKYKASQRIQSLAKPKTVVPKVSKVMESQASFQSTVSTGALKYVPTPRILELARPRQYEVYEDFQEGINDEDLF